MSPDERRQPLTDNTPVELGLTGPSGLWAQRRDGTVGEDVIIGVIDTGIWPEHPSFSDQADLVHDPAERRSRSRVRPAAGDLARQLRGR